MSSTRCVHLETPVQGASGFFALLSWGDPPQAGFMACQLPGTASWVAILKVSRAENWVCGGFPQTLSQPFCLLNSLLPMLPNWQWSRAGETTRGTWQPPTSSPNWGLPGSAKRQGVLAASSLPSQTSLEKKGNSRAKPLAHFSYWELWEQGAWWGKAPCLRLTPRILVY